MKNIVLVLLAALALIGSAAAWQDSETLLYQFQKQIYMQADDPSQLFAGTTSGAYFNQPAPTCAPGTALSYGAANGAIVNKLVAADGAAVGTQIPDQTMTLTQSGGASIVATAPGATVAPEITASMNTYQNMHFSGIYGTGNKANTVDGVADVRGAWANFQSAGAVGIDGFNLEMGTETEEARVKQYDAIGAIEVQDANGDARFTSADIGMSATGGFTKDVTYGGPMLISGSTNAWAGFGGAILGAGDQIQSNTGMYETTFETANAWAAPTIAGMPSW